MPLPRSSEVSVDVDSPRLRFLFACEQLAAQRSSERYFAVRDMRRWVTRRTDAGTADGRPR